MISLSNGCKLMLRRLLSQRRIGGKHIPETICFRWIKHLPKEEHRLALKDWEWCTKEGIILTKPKPGEKHVFLNPRRLEELYELIE